MIENDHQLAVTREHVRKFDYALRDWQMTCNSETHPLLYLAQGNSLRSMLDDLMNQIAEYEAKHKGSKLP